MAGNVQALIGGLGRFLIELLTEIQVSGLLAHVRSFVLVDGGTSFAGRPGGSFLGG
jgi:hypothetical protein